MPATQQRVGGRRWTTRSSAASCARSLTPRMSRSSAAVTRGDRHAVGHRHRDDVGQVELALRVVVAQRARPSACRQRGRRGQDAGVDLADLALLAASRPSPRRWRAPRPRSSRTMRPSPTDRASTAVSSASRPPRARASSSCIAAAGTSGRRRRGRPSRRRRAARPAPRGRVAGAARRVLRDEHDVGRRDRVAHPSPPWPTTTAMRSGPSVARRREHVREQRPAGERVQHLGSAECMRLPWPAARTTMWVGDEDMVERRDRVRNPAVYDIACRNHACNPAYAPANGPCRRGWAATARSRGRSTAARCPAP